jgi:sec-independent protein translocase protein TatA
MRVLEPWHLLILAAVFVALFGAKRLPDAARSLGEAMNIFKRSTREGLDQATPTAGAPVAGAPVAGPPVPARRGSSTDRDPLAGQRWRLMLGISGLNLLAPAALGLAIFGPDRLPRMAAYAGRRLHRARAYADNARTELTGVLPPELSALTTIGACDLSTRGLTRGVLDVDILDDLRAPAPARQPPARSRLGQIPPHDTDAT